MHRQDGSAIVVHQPVVGVATQLIVHTLDEVNTELKKGRYFFKEVRADSIALYEFTGSKSSGNRHHALAEPGNLTPKEVYETAKEYFEDKLPYAKYHCSLFSKALTDGQYRHAAFEIHQATGALPLFVRQMSATLTFRLSAGGEGLIGNAGLCVSQALPPEESACQRRCRPAGRRCGPVP